MKNESAKKYETEELVKLAAAVGLEKKAARPTIIDLRKQECFTHFFLVLSASNARQVSAIADGIRMFLRDSLGIMPVSMDGFETSTWVLLDYGSFFVHIFQESTREMYQLEKLWSKAIFVPVVETEVQTFLAEVRAANPIPVPESSWYKESEQQSELEA